MTIWKVRSAFRRRYFLRCMRKVRPWQGFLPGEHVKIVDLLYGIILPSGGECSMAVAEYAAGSEEAFVEMMNEKAAGSWHGKYAF